MPGMSKGRLKFYQGLLGRHLKRYCLCTLATSILLIKRRNQIAQRNPQLLITFWLWIDISFGFWHLFVYAFIFWCRSIFCNVPLSILAVFKTSWKRNVWYLQNTYIDETCDVSIVQVRCRTLGNRYGVKARNADCIDRTRYKPIQYLYRLICHTLGT